MIHLAVSLILSKGHVMTRQRVGLLFLLASMGLLSPATAHAQGETTSAIVGQVIDATHAALPGATVTVTNQETGLKRTAKTDDFGRFSFLQLKPGGYSARVE